MRTMELEFLDLYDAVDNTIVVTELAYQELANAIVLRAVDDYRNALDGKTYDENPRHTPQWVMKECEKFFRSSWYRSLTKVDGEFLIEQLKREHNEKIRKENNYAR